MSIMYCGVMVCTTRPACTTLEERRRVFKPDVMIALDDMYALSLLDAGCQQYKRVLEY